MCRVHGPRPCTKNGNLCEPYEFVVHGEGHLDWAFHRCVMLAFQLFPVRSGHAYDFNTEHSFHMAACEDREELPGPPFDGVFSIQDDKPVQRSLTTSVAEAGVTASVPAPVSGSVGPRPQAGSSGGLRLPEPLERSRPAPHRNRSKATQSTQSVRARSASLGPSRTALLCAPRHDLWLLQGAGGEAGSVRVRGCAYHCLCRDSHRVGCEVLPQLRSLLPGTGKVSPGVRGFCMWSAPLRLSPDNGLRHSSLHVLVCTLIHCDESMIWRSSVCLSPAGILRGTGGFGK